MTEDELYHSIHGSLPADDLRRAFVAGAKWWEWHKEGATMWRSDVDLAEAEAEKRYPGGKPEELPKEAGKCTCG